MGADGVSSSRAARAAGAPATRAGAAGAAAAAAGVTRRKEPWGEPATPSGDWAGGIARGDVRLAPPTGAAAELQWVAQGGTHFERNLPSGFRSCTRGEPRGKMRMAPSSTSTR